MHKNNDLDTLKSIPDAFRILSILPDNIKVQFSPYGPNENGDVNIENSMFFIKGAKSSMKIHWDWASFKFSNSECEGNIIFLDNGFCITNFELMECSILRKEKVELNLSHDINHFIDSKVKNYIFAYYNSLSCIRLGTNFIYNLMNNAKVAKFRLIPSTTRIIFRLDYEVKKLIEFAQFNKIIPKHTELKLIDNSIQNDAQFQL